MREFLIDTYGVEIIRWDEPTEDGALFEVIYLGRLVRADSAALILADVLAWQPPAPRPAPRLAWTNIIAGTIVLPLRAVAA
jgi:hypothetical protein